MTAASFTHAVPTPKSTQGWKLGPIVPSGPPPTIGPLVFAGEAPTLLSVFPPRAKAARTAYHDSRASASGPYVAEISFEMRTRIIAGSLEAIEGKVWRRTQWSN